MPSLMGAGTVFLMLCMLQEEVRDLRLPMLIMAGIPLIHSHVGGFIAIPDLPLVFFASLFFFIYRKYLQDESPLHIVLLSLSIVLMLYSKYHAFLVIGLTVLSHLKLLRRRSFWLVVTVAIARGCWGACRMPTGHPRASAWSGSMPMATSTRRKRRRAAFWAACPWP